MKKTKKAKGEEHTSYKGTLIPARKIGSPCSCKRRCFEKVSDDEKREILQSFNKLGDKHLQDSYLHGLITRYPVQRHRPRKENTGIVRTNSFVYKVKLNKSITST